MLSRWKKIDLFLTLLVLLTLLSYFFFRAAFSIIFWTAVILVLLRIILYVKKRLLWKIRNRLIFSGLFFVITPIVLVSIFFLFIVYVIIAQYGVIIVDNLIKRQVAQYEASAEGYLAMSNAAAMVERTRLWSRFRPPNLAVAFYRLKSRGWDCFFTYPEDLDVARVQLNTYSGYFRLNGQLYLGTVKKQNDYAVVISLAVNQDFLDQLARVSDFKMRFVDHDAGMNRMDQAETITRIASDDGELLFLPWPYRFQYKDFDADITNRMAENEQMAWLLIDYEKIFEKLRGFGSKTRQINIQKFIYFLIGLFATFIVISFFIGFRIIRVVTRSINLMIRGTEKIRRGDFSFRIKIKSGDQMQVLAESFNEMASGISRLLTEEKEKQRLEEELRIARSIQLRLLPEETLKTDEFEIAAVNIPAEEIAGDYFDYFYQEGEFMSILVADVSGKGASAAFYMAELKGIVNYLQTKQLAPAELIRECHLTLRNSFDKSTFITLSMAAFNVKKQSFIFARAGHTPALFYSRQTGECRELNPQGSAVGLINFLEKPIEEVPIRYRTGDLLFLFSDGLSEIFNEAEEMLGIENLKQLICENHHLPSEEIRQKILDFSIQFAEKRINTDDLTFIILKVK